MDDNRLGNLSDLFRRRMAASPEAIAYRFHDGERWVSRSWAQTAAEVSRWQQALRKEGLRPGDRVGVCLRNGLEWVLFDQAALGLDLVVVPLFYNDRPESMAWCLNDAGARLLLLGEGLVWPALRDQIPGVQRAVMLHAAPVDDPRAVSLRDWLPPVDTVAPPVWGTVGRDALATIVYTSGTTGRSKGVMLTHGNILSNVVSLVNAARQVVIDDEFLSFLPLSHMFERTVGYYVPIHVGAVTCFARSVPQLGEDLLSQRPTVLVAVPRVFERIYATIQDSVPVGTLKRRLFDAAVEVGWRCFCGRPRAGDGWRRVLLDRLVGRALRRRFGGRLRYVLLGGAPMSHHLFRVFIGLGLRILHGYGLTETSPVISFNRVGDNEPFSVGRPLEGVEVRSNEQGELLVRGPNVMRGYWNNPDATAAAIDPDGWFSTGDLVSLTGGRIYVTGRLKDIIVLSNGEKISPTDVEQAILADPVFEQVMLVGEGRPRLGMLVVSGETDPRALCRRANDCLKEVPGYIRIRHVWRTDKPWTVEDDLLTPTLKLKRAELERRFIREIELMYRQESC